MKLEIIFFTSNCTKRRNNLSTNSYFLCDIPSSRFDQYALWDISKWHLHHEMTVCNTVGVLESAYTFNLRHRPSTPPVGIYWPMTYIESCTCTSCYTGYDTLNTKSVLVKFRISLLTDSHLYTPVKTITSFCVLNLRWHRLGWWSLNFGNSWVGIFSHAERFY